MSDRPTPETDAMVVERRSAQDWLEHLRRTEEFARRLERQRDAAVEALKAAEAHLADYLASIAPFSDCKETRSGKLHAAIRAVLREIEGKS